MITYPDWSDLSLGHLSTSTRLWWEDELRRNERLAYYFDGLVFEEQVSEASSYGDPPLIFPVGLNLVKMLCLALTDAAFGEWNEQPVLFGTRQDEEVTEIDKAAISWAQTVLEDNNAGSLLWEHELDRNVFGAGAIKISPDLTLPGHVRWTRIPRDTFFPVWDPDDPNRLLEAYIVTPMTSDQALAKYKYEARNDIVQRLEYWSETKYENFLDNKPMPKYTGVNPWGVVPFVYTPRYRFSNWWGESLAHDVIPVQDELNMRIADIGETINYNSHPVRYGFNLPRDFTADNYPIAPNSFWNLGRSIGGLNPEVGLMESKNAISPGTLQYLEFIYNWARLSAFAPPIAFGEDDGGGQRSGVTLEIRMWPLIKATRRSRTYLRYGLTDALKISSKIIDQKKFPNIEREITKPILAGKIVPQFANIMPRDQAAIVDQVIKLLSTDPPTISLETSQSILGRGSGEVKRIREMLADKSLWTNIERPAQQDQPQQSDEV